MVARKSKKASVRRVGDRRVKQIQRLTNKEIQAIEALVESISTAMDFDWDPSPQRSARPFWAVVYPRFREVTWALRKSLQKRILHSKRIRRVHVEPKARYDGEGDRQNKPLGVTVVRGGLPPDARITPPLPNCDTTAGSDEDIQRVGRCVLCED